MAIRKFIWEWWDAFEELEFEPEEVRALGNRVTFSVIHQDARPARSTGQVRTREAHVIEWVTGTDRAGYGLPRHRRGSRCRQAACR